MPKILNPQYIKQTINRGLLEKYPILLEKSQAYNSACEPHKKNPVVSFAHFLGFFDFFNCLNFFNVYELTQENREDGQIILSAANCTDDLLKLAELQDTLEAVIRSEQCIAELKSTVVESARNAASKALAIELHDIIINAGINIKTELGYIITDAHMATNYEMVGEIKAVFEME